MRAFVLVLLVGLVALAQCQDVLPCPPADVSITRPLFLLSGVGTHDISTTFDLSDSPYEIEDVRIVVNEFIPDQTNMIFMRLEFNGITATLLDDSCGGTLWTNTFFFQEANNAPCPSNGRRQPVDGNDLNNWDGLSAQGIWTLTARYTGNALGVSVNTRLEIDFAGSPPQINCYSATVTNDPGVCGANVYYREPDTCATSGTAIVTRTGAESGSFFPVGQTSVGYRLDVGVAFDTCTTSVTVRDDEPPTVTGCPTNIVVAADAGPTCGTSVTWSEIAIASSDNCGAGLTTSQTHTPGAFFGVGVSNVVYSAQDASGNVGSCSFTVTVTDASAPVFTNCPGDVTEVSACNDAGTVVSWTEPSLASDCLSYRAQNFSPGEKFPDGVTTVAYVAIQGDESSTCVFDVIVAPCQGEAGANRPPGAFGTIDLDGDGYFSDAPLVEWRDCCDSPEDMCDDPFMVNPGAFEIPHNGQEDSCRGIGFGGDVDGHAGGCDFDFVFSTDTSLIGPTILASETEKVAQALDLCEFKDDDDDPSWGFGRQKSLTFTLANGTRNGYDIGIDGPHVSQASVLRNFGKITPAQGHFMVAISTGTARDNVVGGNVPPSPGFTTGNTAVNVPATFLNGGLGDFIEDCANDQYAIGLDSIRLNMDVIQPTNMNGFSLKAMYLDNELEALQGTYPANGACVAERQSWFLAIKTDSQTGVSRSGNFAGDNSGRSFNSYNDNPDFWQQCRDFDEVSGACAQGHRGLADTGYGGASGWTTIGTSAQPGERFSLDLVTFEGTDSNNDVLVLLDDFFPITEARTKGSDSFASRPWGYHYETDLEMVFVGPQNNAYVVPRAGTSSVTIDFTIRNWGPEEANDVFVSFTPPVGTSFATAKDSSGSSMTCSATSINAPYADNGFHKCQFRSNPTIAAQTSVSGSISFNVDLDCEACEASIEELRFRLTASLSSLDKELGNNYLVTAVTIV